MRDACATRRALRLAIFREAGNLPTMIRCLNSPIVPGALAVAALLGAFATLTDCALAADLTPSLGKKGKLLLEEKFDGSAVPKGFAVNTGKLSVSDGSLHASELAKNMHIGAFRYRLPLQDCAVQLDFKFEGARIFNIGFDPAPGELKKKGHLFSVIVTPASWQITEHNDKADSNSKPKTHATAKIKLEKGKWYTLLVESKGNDIAAQINGIEPLKATARDFHVKKPGLVFRMGGKDDDEVLFDNVKVWELK